MSTSACPLRRVNCTTGPAKLPVAATVRLAESIAHQLDTTPSGDRRCRLIVIGDALPLPNGATLVPSLRELGSVLTAQDPGGAPDVVFCRPHSDQDALELERCASGPGPSFVPVVLGGLPGAPWSFTARPTPHPADTSTPRLRNFEPGLAAEVRH